MKLTIVVPVHNQKNNIPKVIEDVNNIQLDKEVIIIDNSSTDGTRDILRDLNDKRIKVVYQSVNYGYGMSVITGMNLAQGEYILIYNPDLEYSPEYVYAMLDLAEKENLDAVYGSKKRPLPLGTIIATSLVNSLYGKDFFDLIGNRLYKKNSLKQINPRTTGVGFDFEVVSKLCKHGFKIKEIPVEYSHRIKWKKEKFYNIIPAVWTILKVKFFG